MSTPRKKVASVAPFLSLIFSRAQLEEKLYSWKDSVSSNAVEVYIHGLRKKLGQDLIQNVRGVGYVIPKT